MFSIEQGVAFLDGALTFETVEALLPQGYSVLEQNTKVVFDLSRVREVDSAGLALLIAWCRFAKKRELQPRFAHIPDTMKSLMAVTNISTVLREFLL